MRLRKQGYAFVSSCCLATCLLGHITADSQTSLANVPPYSILNLAEEQYEQGHYSVALQSARNVLYPAHISIYGQDKGIADKASYYLALASLKLNIQGCVDTAQSIIRTTSNPVYKQRVAYTLAQYYFGHGQLAAAIPYYEMAGIANLSNKELINEKFELAYCYFNNRDFDKAVPLFASIKELKNGKYYAAGNYYYGLLTYNANNYQEALQSFERIQDEPQYRNIVPYYIAEIYYFLGNKQKALSEAEELIQRPEKLYYDNELYLLAAQCYFEFQKYQQALPYFEHYYDHTEKIKKEDLYEMAYCYYSVSQWKNATDKFKLLSNTRDSLGQSAMYLLGDCYLKTGDKQSARNAFSICADMPFNPGQQEASMILDAKLSYEMGYNDEALQQLNNLLTTFPNTLYKDEAKTLLSALLIKTNNYAAALEQLKEVGNKGRNYQEVYQKVTYGIAIQQFQANNLNIADSFFNMSLLYPVDINYEAAAYFWKGELKYRQRNFADAIKFLQIFTDEKTSPSSVQYLSPASTHQHAYIDMGYAAMEEGKYDEAQEYFNRVQTIPGIDSSSRMVAILNQADAVFMQKDYNRALLLYDKVIAGDSSNAAYARFQKSILLGLTGKTNEKIALLQMLISQAPPTSYASNARYELALTYIELGKYNQAIPLLKPLTESVDGRGFAAKAWIKTGFAWQELGENDKAIAAYKHVITDYASSEERPAALDALKSLYIENGQPGAYAKLLHDNNLPTNDIASFDSTYYAAGEAQFASGKWDKAKEALSQYLRQYPNGVFVIKAHYYRAESNYQLKNYAVALEDYDSVLTGPWNDFTENSAKRAAAISFSEKNYHSAYNYYERLRTSAMGKENLQMAYDGLMKSSFNIEKYKETANYADTLTTLPGVDTATLDEALFYKAKSLQHFEKPGDALAIYEQLRSNKDQSIAAESRYHIAEIYLQQDKLKEAENAANETIKQSQGSDYWVVRAYLLLADILTREKDYFNAKATLQSLVKNVKIPELKQEAAKKLDEVKKLEKEHSKLSDE